MPKHGWNVAGNCEHVLGTRTGETDMIPYDTVLERLAEDGSNGNVTT